MPKIIVTSRYMRNTPKRTAKNLVKYMATREGAEKTSPGFSHKPATIRQMRLIGEIIKSFPDAAEYSEYADYQSEPCRGAATEFIDAFLERNADRVGNMKKMAEYIATRPGAEKLGPHGLFGQSDDEIDLDSVADEVGNHPGIIWTHVISLRREDAERLGYNNAKAWRDLIRRNIPAVAAAQKIDLDNLQWFAAFHNTAHHPHVHLLLYAKDAKQGYLTNRGIDLLRSTFGNDIFREEQYKLFAAQTDLRDKLKETVDDALRNIGSNDYLSREMIFLFQTLSSQLKKYRGRKQYAYLPKEIKSTVDAIVRELTEFRDISEIYDEWNRMNKEKLSLYYDHETPDIPLEANKEFRSIKNAIIRAAVDFGAQDAARSNPYEFLDGQLRSIAAQLICLISASYHKKLNRLRGQVDKKLRSKIEEKKQAHGLRTDFSVTESDGEDEGQGSGMQMM